jgi:hypothetical protein
MHISKHSKWDNKLRAVYMMADSRVERNWLYVYWSEKIFKSVIAEDNGNVLHPLLSVGTSRLTGCYTVPMFTSVISVRCSHTSTQPPIAAAAGANTTSTTSVLLWLIVVFTAAAAATGALLGGVLYFRHRRRRSAPPPVGETERDAEFSLLDRNLPYWRQATPIPDIQPPPPYSKM